MSTKKVFDLATVEGSLSKNSKDFLNEVQKEIVDEEHDALKDFVKGAYRLMLEKQKEIKSLQADVESLEQGIQEASKGKWESISKIKIPARFFEESTLRKHGKTLLGNNEEVRFLDLYTTVEE